MNTFYGFLLLMSMTSIHTNPLFAQWLQSDRGGYTLSRDPILTIRYQVPQNTHVILRVYNTLGRQVASLVNDQQGPGAYEAKLDGTGLASGMYFYRIEAAGSVLTKKILLIH
jgi:hypothetical protein